MRSWIRTGLELTLAAWLAVAASPAAAATALETAEARSRVKAAQQAYDLAKFDDALREYSEAYRLDARPAFLFNIAQCHRQLGNYERATFFYRRYLDLSPKRPPNAAMVEGLIQEVEARAAEELRQRKLRADEAAAKASDTPAAPKLDPAPPPARQELAAAPSATVVQEPPENDSLVGKWWFWTGVGVVAAAAVGTTAYFVTRPPGTTLEPIHGP